MYECIHCSYCYNPGEGVPLFGISPGTLFEDLPEDFICPSCGSPRGDFVPVGGDVDTGPGGN
jgi:rubredoxin